MVKCEDLDVPDAPYTCLDRLTPVNSCVGTLFGVRAELQLIGGRRYWNCREGGTSMSLLSHKGRPSSRFYDGPTRTPQLILFTVYKASCHIDRLQWRCRPIHFMGSHGPRVFLLSCWHHHCHTRGKNSGIQRQE